jgi:hypothetical protein
LPVGLPPTRRIRKVSLDSSLSGRPEPHCEAHVGSPASQPLVGQDSPARVVNAWREAQAAVADQSDSDVTMAGWPLGEMTDPFVLEVHRPVQPENAPPGLPLLLPYEERLHDDVLGQVRARWRTAASWEIARSLY